MDEQEREILRRGVWGAGHALGVGHAASGTTSMGGSMRLSPQDAERARKFMEAHEEMHAEGRRRYVEQMKLHLAPLTEEEWEEVKRHRDSTRLDD